MDFSFKKEERIIHRLDFEKLLKNGKVEFTYPFRAVWIITDLPQPYPVKIAFAVPKKKFKRANKRNLLKRRMREAFRLNKHLLYSALKDKNLCILLLMVYIGNEILTYHEMEKKSIAIFQHIMEHMQQNP